MLVPGLPVLISSTRKEGGNDATHGTAIALASLLAGCATWHDMDRSEKGTAAGATGGALVGGVIGGPVGAAIGAGAGGYVGHHQGLGEPATENNATDAAASTQPYASDRKVSGNAVAPSTISASDRQDHELIRSVQKALNEKGYDAGAVDGMWGPHTSTALQHFQQAQDIPQSNGLGDRTLNALGVSTTSMASSRGNDNSSTTANATTSANTSPSNNATTSTNSSPSNNATTSTAASSSSSGAAKPVSPGPTRNGDVSGNGNVSSTSADDNRTVNGNGTTTDNDMKNGNASGNDTAPSK